jgi:UDP-N-acetylglucosamine 2-epimerase
MSTPHLFLSVLDALDALPHPVVLPLHPRTQAALETAAPGCQWTRALRLGSAVGYHQSLALCRDATLVITDSGGVQREAYWLGTPCITMRAETEWGETVEERANVVLDPATALSQP